MKGPNTIGTRERVRQKWQKTRRDMQRLASPDADTPIRRPADTLPLPAAHFERNDVTIICETVLQGFFAEMLSIRPSSGSNPRLTCPTNDYFGQQCSDG